MFLSLRCNAFQGNGMYGVREAAAEEEEVKVVEADEFQRQLKQLTAKKDKVLMREHAWNPLPHGAFQDIACCSGVGATEAFWMFEAS
eukprot:1428492-Amphidinium_carterae.1